MLLNTRIIVSLICCVGGSVQEQKQGDACIAFGQRQHQLFFEIDHETVYGECQVMMRLCRDGKYDRTYYFCDDPNGLNELPETIRLLRPAYVLVDETTIGIGFFDGNEMQSLMIRSDEFGRERQKEGDERGYGFRKSSSDMDMLTGMESLEYLNTTYREFQLELLVGMDYQRNQKKDNPTDLKQLKAMLEQMAEMQKVFKEIQQELVLKKRKLLHQTDPAAFLDCCRQLHGQYKEGMFSEDKIDFDYDNYTKDMKLFPKMILDMKPVYVWFDDAGVMVALIGGLDHAGAIAYLTDDAEVQEDRMKLIDGLVYYDDGLREADADYKDYLKKGLKVEAISYLDWKRKQMKR